MIMTKDEITQIKVGHHRMGIIGLKHVLTEVFRKFDDRSDDDVKAELTARLSACNYIPESKKKEYAEAFLREFKKFVGRPYDEDKVEGLEIKVLGGGCPCCDQLEQDLMAVMTELNLSAGIEHVTDCAEIKNYGVTGTPALVINGEVKAVGSMPKMVMEKADDRCIYEKTFISRSLFNALDISDHVYRRWGRLSVSRHPSNY
jgi:hypothetical protein